MKMGNPILDEIPEAVSDDDADPFAEGADARLAGKPETANPYDPELACDSCASWDDGWHDIDEEDE